MNSAQLLQTLGLTVLHMLWVGALIGGAVFTWLRSRPSAAPATRYACAVVGLAALLIGTGSTFAFLASSHGDSPVAHRTEIAISSSADATPMNASAPSPAPRLGSRAIGSGFSPTSTVAWMWIIGLGIMSMRLVRQSIAVRRIRLVGVTPPPTGWTRTFDRLKSKIGVHPRVAMMASHAIDTPMVVGWIRPLVLVPATAFTSLTPEQLRMVLAHELLHIARRDHLVNMLQAVIEVLLFFHPVTWWLSRQIRVERENCCDDAALLVTGSPRCFAEALLVLESIRTDARPSGRILAATGEPLMHRISRLFGSDQPQPLNAGWRTVSACTLLAVAGLACATAAIDPIATAQDRDVPRAEQVDLEELKARIEGRIRAMGADLREQVAAGRISEADARARFEEGEKRMWMRYRAAEEQNATRGKSEPDHDAAVERMTRMVKNGEITKEQMRQRLDRMKQAESKGRPDARRRMSRADYDAAVERMTGMVKNGEITKEQMQQRLDRMKQAASKEGAKAQERIDLEELKAKIEERVRAMEMELREKVAAGQISETDAKARFEEGEKRMWMRYRAAEQKNADAMKAPAKNDRIDLEELKAKIEERVREMGTNLRKQVAAGELTADEARAKFEKGEARMWERYRAAEARNAEAMKNGARTDRVDLDELKTNIEERIRAMGMDLRKQVAAGEITADEGRARFEKGEARMWERYRAAEAKNAEAGKSKRDYDAAVRKMTEMVEDGKITREQMQRRLEQMKDRMGGSRKPEAPDGAEYMEAERKMAAMVKAGEITKEQMRQRLDRMKQDGSKKQRKTGKDGGRRMSRNDYDAAVKRMTEMVEDGTITREQMQQRLDRMKQAEE